MIASLFPFVAELLNFVAGELLRPALHGVPSTIWLLISLANIYVPAYVVAAMFSRAANLRSRLPTIPPGQTWILLGLVLTAGVLGTRVVASFIQGGGYSFVVSQYAPYINIPAKALILVGVVKVLLAALPRLAQRSTPSHIGTTSPRGS